MNRDLASLPSCVNTMVTLKMSRKRPLPPEEDDLCSITSTSPPPLEPFYHLTKPYSAPTAATGSLPEFDIKSPPPADWKVCQANDDPLRDDEGDISFTNVSPVNIDIRYATGSISATPGLSTSSRTVTSTPTSDLPITPITSSAGIHDELASTSTSSRAGHNYPSTPHQPTKSTKRKRKGKPRSNPTATPTITPSTTSLPTHKHVAHLTPQGLPPLTVPLNLPALFLLFRFAAERHRMYESRQNGVPRDRLTEDEGLRRMFVGNVFRELDRGSVRVREEVVGKGEMSLEEVCCE